MVSDLKGRAISNEEGQQELEQRAPIFRILVSFWENGVHEWQTNAVPSRTPYIEARQEPQWQGSVFMVYTYHKM